MTVTLPTVAPGTTGTHYVDLSQIASIVNRRFYRQGINWALSGIKIRSAAGALGVVSVVNYQTLGSCQMHGKRVCEHGIN
jgi:hypothetical protein